MKLPTSIELNGLPLYASANSAASVGLKNFKTTNERFGAKSLGGKGKCNKLDMFRNATMVSHTGLCEGDRYLPQRAPQRLESLRASSMMEQPKRLA
jgi:hypothetical protein